jgi:hypothetical protein
MCIVTVFILPLSLKQELLYCRLLLVLFYYYFIIICHKYKLQRVMTLVYAQNYLISEQCPLSYIQNTECLGPPSSTEVRSS